MADDAESDDGGISSPSSVGLAFGLVIAAGAATCLGAGVALLFFTKLDNMEFLAGALGVSAGVMLYVSFVEIIQKSITAFEDSGFSEDRAFIYGTLAFFGGMVFTWLLDCMCHSLIRLAARWPSRRARAKSADMSRTPSLVQLATEQPQQDPEVQSRPTAPAAPAAALSAPAVTGRTTPARAGVLPVICLSHVHLEQPPQQQQQPDRSANSEELLPRPPTLVDDDDHGALLKMGLLSALAVGLHNLPEGIATFIGAIVNPATGVTIAVAIALHNIPEGIVVAMPIAYATGSKWKGFLWACISAIAEPVGGVIAYLILRSTGMNHITFALLFGLVAGIMVWIAIKELIPTALRYDPKDRITTWAVMVGFVVMALSLVVFKI